MRSFAMQNTSSRIGYCVLTLSVLSAWLLSAYPAPAADFSSWSNKMRVTFTGYNREEALANFPTLVTFSNRPGFTYAQFLSDDHGDLRFADATMTNELAYEVESWDTNGTSYVWVQVPELAGTNTCVWAFWGMAATNAESYTTNGATWNSTYIGVWHMAQVHAQDSTSNRFNGVGSGSVSQASGIVNGADSFLSSNDYVQVPDSTSFTFTNSPFTVSAWINIQTPSSYHGIVGSYGPPGFILAITNIGTHTLCFYDAAWQSSTVSIPTGVWKQVAYSRNGTNGTFYVDGAGVRTVPAVDGSNGGPLRLGQGGTNWGANPLRGLLDEVRISGTDRSANWMWAAYQNQASNAAFATVWLGVPSVSNAAPEAVSNHSAMAMGYLSATGDAPATVNLHWGTNDGKTVFTNWQSTVPVEPVEEGPLSVTLTNLMPDQIYWYTFSASNTLGEVWAEPSVSFHTWGVPSVNNAGGAMPVGAKVAFLNGTLLDGFGAVASFFWGETSDSLTNETVVGSVLEGSFSIALTGLQSSATYYYCSFVSNAYGSAWAESTNSFTTAATAPFLHVGTNGTPAGDGSTWETALRDVQSALNAAEEGDEIRLAGHTFWLTNELRWTNTTGVVVRGGWEGVGTPGSNNPFLWPTVVARDPSVANTRLMTVGCVTGSLAGVTLQDGLVISAPYFGGGLRVTNSTFTLDNCQIVGNTVSGVVAAAQYYGGGLYAAGSSILITNCTFSRNVAYSREGGGSYVFGAGCLLGGATAEIVDSVFETNAITGKGHNIGGPDYGYGAGMYAGSSTTTIRNCEFRGNTQYGRGTTGSGQNPRTVLRGGAIYAAKPVFVHHTVIKGQSLYGSYNQPGCDSRGGGIYGVGPVSLMNVLVMNNHARSATPGSVGDGIGAQGNLFMTNCTVVKNGVIVSGRSGVWVAGTNPVAVVNSILWHNGDELVGFPTNAAGVLTNVWNCDTEDGDNAGAQGCLSVTPGFDHGYYLATNSPCVNAGNEPAANLGLEAYTARADGVLDAGTVDLGYHPRTGMDPAISEFYVLGTGDDSNSGTNWGEAFRSVTKALSVAQDGTYIHIGAGQYTNTVETFPLAITRWGLRLLGTNAEACVVNAAGANQRVIAVGSVGEIYIDGLAIRGGRYGAGNPYQGSGIYAAYSTLTLSGCHIETNSISPAPAEGHIYGGAGVYTLSSALAITNCVIANNTMGDGTGRSITYSGAGCMIESGDPVEIVDTVFLKNASRARGYSGIGSTLLGGGLYSGAPLALRNCTVTSNDLSASLGSIQGAGVYAASTLTASECTVQGNRGIGENNGGSGGGANPALYGGGIRAAGALKVSRSVITGNRLTASYRGGAYGGGIYGGAVELQNALLAGNVISASNNYGGGLYASGALAISQATVVSNQVSGIASTGTGGALVRNAIVWGNGDDLVGFATNEVGVLTNVFYCDIEDGDNNGTNGCIMVNPRFADSTYYHLSSTKGCYAGGYFGGGTWTNTALNSPLIDAGDPISARDLEPMPNGGRANLGAYGNTPVASISSSRGAVILIN